MPTRARVVVQPVEPGPLQVRELQLPDPGPYQVVVRQFASGICHSQLHQMHRPRTAPVVLGHESIGEVTSIGSAVEHVKPGDIVFVTWVPRNAPQAARYPQGAKLELPEGTIAQSQAVFTWADYTIADEEYVVKVPRGIAKDVLAIIGCAIMTGAGAVTHTAGVKRGQSVAVFGAGGVGLAAIAAAKRVGANPIIAVDLSDEKLAFAKQFGATVGVNASREDPVARIHALTPLPGEYDSRGNQRSGVDFAFDCIGVRPTMEQLLPSVRGGTLGRNCGGTAVLVGVPTTPMEIQPADLLVNEKRFIGSIGGSCVPERDFAEFVHWYEEGAMDLDAMVTQRFSLDEINEAADALEHGRIAGRAILTF